MFNKKLLVLFFVFLYACSGKTITINNNQFKLTKTTEYLACLKPNEIKEINSIYLKSANGTNVYLVEMYGSQGNCSWQVDELSFKSNKNNIDKEKLNILQQYNPNVYLTSNIQFKFKVTKLNTTQNVDYTSITIPYFVLLNNKSTNTIINTQNLQIKINLPQQGSKIFTSGNVSINEQFLLSVYNDMELLSGIYVGKQL